MVFISIESTMYYMRYFVLIWYNFTATFVVVISVNIVHFMFFLCVDNKYANFPFCFSLQIIEKLVNLLITYE